MANQSNSGFNGDSTILSARQHVPHHHHTSLAVKLMTGAVAGVVGTSIIYPIDFIKTTLQAQRNILASDFPSSSKPSRADTIWSVFRRTIKAEGFRGMYKGILPNLIGVIPEKAIKLAVNDQAREFWAARSGTDPSRLPLFYGIISGATAGFCQVIATNPMEMVKIQLQLSSSLTMSGVVRSLGLRGLYRGSLATLGRDVPFSFIFFPLLSTFKNAGPRARPGSDEPSFGTVFFSGIFAGLIAAATVTPADVVKTRLQMTPKPGDFVYKNMAHCYRHIIRTEGARALFKGVVPRMLIVSPLFAITVLVYELQQSFLSAHPI